jgi:hypothetical protein
VEGLFLSTVDNPRGASLSPIGAFLGQQARALATYPPSVGQYFLIGSFYLSVLRELSRAIRVMFSGGERMSWWFIGTIVVALLALIDFMIWVEKNRE